MYAKEVALFTLCRRPPFSRWSPARLRDLVERGQLAEFECPEGQGGMVLQQHTLLVTGACEVEMRKVRGLKTPTRPVTAAVTNIRIHRRNGGRSIRVRTLTTTRLARSSSASCSS